MADLLISEQEEPDIRGLSRQQQQQQPTTTNQPEHPVQVNSYQGQQVGVEGRSDGRAIRGFKDTDLAAVINTSDTSDITSNKASEHPHYRQLATHYASPLTHLPHARDAQYANVTVKGDDEQPRDGLGVPQTPIASVETGMNRGVTQQSLNHYSSSPQTDDYQRQEKRGSSFLFAKQYESEAVINEKGEVEDPSSPTTMVDPLSPMPYHRFRSQFGNQNQRVSPSTTQSGGGNGGGLLGIGGILKSRSNNHKSSSTTLGSGVNDMHARFGLLSQPRGSPNHLLHNNGGAGGVGVADGHPSGPGGIPPPVVLESIGPIRPTKSIAELFTPGRKLGSEPGWKESGWNTLKSSYLVYLLPLVPVAWALHLSHQQPVISFVFAFLAIIPLASLLSFATEQLALRMGDALGGLLNATFGNAVELLISILALVKGEIGLVQASMIGSILSNTLLVLGFCFFCGGLRFHEQIYSTSASQLQISLLGIAMCALVLPAAFQFSLSSLSTSTVIRPIEEITDLDSRSRSMLLSISRGTSFMLLSTYAVYLIFQLYTHAYLFKRRPQAIKRPHHEPGAPRPNHAKVLPISEWVAAVRSRGSASSSSDGLTPTTTRDTIHMTTMTDGAASTAVDLEMGGNGSIRDTRSVLEFAQDDDEEEEEIPLVKAFFALGLLLVVTGITGVTAEFLVDSIDGVTESTSISREFVGLVLLPIVGNIPETVCAITVSVKDKLDLALSIAVGSTIQVALGLLPLLVLVGWAVGQPMSLFFDPFQIISLAVCLIIVAFAISDGRSCFAEGYILIMTYFIFALCSWYYDPSLVT